MLGRFLCTYFAAFCLMAFTPSPSAGLAQQASETADMRRSEAKALFREQIAPILASRCQACHGLKQAGGYSVATPAQLFVPGDSELKPVVGTMLQKSELWLRLVSDDASARMPADATPLTQDQLAAFRIWIEAGAPVELADQNRSMSAIAITRSVVAPEHYQRAVAIHAITISNRAETIWVGGYAEVTQWRVATGELLARVPVSGPHVAAIALAPDGHTLLVSSGSPGQRGAIEWISVGDPNNSRVALDATSDVAADLAVTHDGQRIAIGGQDGSLRVVELLSDHRFGQSITMTPHADAVLALAWSADDKRLITASCDRTAKLFDSAKMELIASYDRHERAVGGAAFLSNRPLSLDETGRLRLMEGDDSDGVVAEQSGLPRVLQRFKADTQEIFIADRNRIREFRIDIKTVDDGTDEQGKPKQKTVTRFREGKSLEVGLKEWITSTALSDSALAVGTQQGTITVWDRSTNQPLGSFLAKP